jgi:sigma-B regulation protein RsbU (phosphoserine phosphatase)
MVGGDYYDFLDMGPGEVGLVLADVGGKGLPAALLMASLQGNLHHHYGSWPTDIAQLLASANQHFYKHSAKDRYAALFFARYRDATRTLQYVNCGHHPPLLIRRDGAIERLHATATVLGLFPDWKGGVTEARLETGGHSVLIYRRDHGNNWPRWRRIRRDPSPGSRELEAVHILRNVPNAVEQFRLGKQADHLTLVIARAR